VIGLAPSAAAADVLAGELGVGTDNTAKWLTEHRKSPTRIEERQQIAAVLAAYRDSANAQRLRERVQSLDTEIARWRLQPGQLLIIDEAGLAGTFALDELVRAAGDAGAKVLLSGDWAQQGSVDAGGAFGLLARDDTTSVAELGEVHRFSSEWERTASIDLRHGNEGALDAYESHDRITGGTREELLEAVYTAWKHDIDAGRSSLMIAPDTATVIELNRRARADRIAAGEVAEDGLTVAAGQMIGVSDHVVTRRNDRHLATGTGWVKNGDCWLVTGTNDCGAMTVRRAGGQGVVVLPAHYVAEHVELAYATTAHRSQGRTVGTAHALVSPSTTRETLYVTATRGRDANRLYVDTAYDPDPQTSHDHAGDPRTAREVLAAVLAAVLANTAVETSAHETLRRAQHEAESWSSLHAEYHTIAQAAQAERWNTLLEHSGLTDEQLQQVRASGAHGPLLIAFRDADSRGLDLESSLPRLVQARSLANADDPASVLHERVERWIYASCSRRPPRTNLIAGLIPRALGVTDPDFAHALNERDKALEHRARLLAEKAVTDRVGWLRQLGSPPVDPTRRAEWMRAISTVAAYRELWNITADDQALGPPSRIGDLDQAKQRQQALAVAEQARRLSSTTPRGQATGLAVSAPTASREGIDI